VLGMAHSFRMRHFSRRFGSMELWHGNKPSTLYVPVVVFVPWTDPSCLNWWAYLWRPVGTPLTHVYGQKFGPSQLTHPCKCF
jgi:hypothetical protein